MRKAIEAAENAGELNEVPIGACLIDNEGNLLAAGGNRTITDSDPTAHAEILGFARSGAKDRQLSPDRRDCLFDNRTVRDVRGRIGQCENQKIGLWRKRRTLRRGRNTFRHLRQQFFESQNRNHIRRFSR